MYLNILTSQSLTGQSHTSVWPASVFLERCPWVFAPRCRLKGISCRMRCCLPPESRSIRRRADFILYVDDEAWHTLHDPLMQCVCVLKKYGNGNPECSIMYKAVNSFRHCLLLYYCISTLVQKKKGIHERLLARFIIPDICWANQTGPTLTDSQSQSAKWALKTFKDTGKLLQEQEAWGEARVEEWGRCRRRRTSFSFFYACQFSVSLNEK